MIGVEYLPAVGQWMKPDGRRYFAYERNRKCNRCCSHCGVPDQYNPEKELTLEQSYQVFDQLHKLGFRGGTILGGEPLALFKTKEGITFYEQTLAEIRYAKKKHMLLGLSTNGDFFTEDTADDLSKAGLSWITFSLHTETEKELDRFIKCGKMAAGRGIISIIHTLITKDNAASFPGIAARVVENGLLVNATVVQEKGESFSKKPEVSLIPSREQQADVFEALLRLKKYGFVRINRRLLLKGLDYYPNNWKCDPEKDNFLHIGAGGTLDVCEEVRTDLSIFDIDSLKDKRWREQKKELAEKCTGCLYRCYYESENSETWGDITTIAVMGLIKIGQADLVRKWGEVAVRRSKRLEPDIDWSLNLN